MSESLSHSVSWILWEVDAEMELIVQVVHFSVCVPVCTRMCVGVGVR